MKTSPVNIKSLICIIFISFLVLSGITPHVNAMNDQEKQNINDMQVFLDLVNKHIEMINGYYDTANNPECVASFAVMEIKSLYEDRGDPQGAIRELRKLLSQTKSRTVRNVIRLQLNDLLKHTGDKDAAQENLEALIRENI